MKVKKITRLIFLGAVIIFSLVLIAYEAISFEIDINKIFNIGKSTKKALEDFNEEEQYYVGRSAGAHLLSEYKLHNPGNLQNYVSNIGQVLSMVSDRPDTFKGYHFIVLDEPDKVNAFAVPGGFIFITTGLISKASNEDELAGVLAHEIAHIVFRHPIGSIKKAYRDQLGKDILSFAAGQVSEEEKNEQIKLLVEGLNELSGMLIDNAAKGYSRKKEDEADAEAIKLMINAGYNPGALAKVLKKLSPVGSGKSGTHGKPNKRSKNVVAAINKIEAIPYVLNERTERFTKLIGD